LISPMPIRFLLVFILSLVMIVLTSEERFIAVGLLDGRMVVIVWTPRSDARRIISMRYANDREISRYKKNLG